MPIVHRNSVASAVLALSALIFLIGCGGEGDDTIGGSPVNTVSVPANQYNADVAKAWFDLGMNLVKEQRLSPPVASRIFGYLGVALYEAVVPGIPTHRSLVGQVNGLTHLPVAAADQEYHWPTVANSALATTLRSLLATRADDPSVQIAALEDNFSKQFKETVSAPVFSRSVAFGQAIGAAIFEWSFGDGYSTYNNCAYTPPVGPGLWEKTPPAFADPLQPCWGQVRPFVLRSGTEVDPGPPPAYSETPGTPFYNEGKEVYDTVKNLTDEQRTIALFWSDDPGQTATPPAHSISILNQVVEERNLRLDVAAEAYAKVGMATADAFIVCWATKYQYNLMRPITYIRKVFDPNWNALLNTPPFPEYTSGHSVQSGASMRVLTDMFGANYAFTDHTHDARGFSPRSFPSFFAAAEEAAISRLYGGIHFRAAIERGIEQGKEIGRRVSALRFRR